MSLLGDRRAFKRLADSQISADTEEQQGNYPVWHLARSLMGTAGTWGKSMFRAVISDISFIYFSHISPRIWGYFSKFLRLDQKFFVPASSDFREKSKVAVGSRETPKFSRKLRAHPRNRVPPLPSHSSPK
jgi:hypothetical protein